MGVNRSVGPARAWYPSGPRLDGSSSSTSELSNPNPNPNPNNYTVVTSQQVGDLFVSKIRYPNCTNFEGIKIIISDFNPKRRTTIDPHFTQNGGIIARFMPTDEGWSMAINFAQSIRRS